MKTVKVTLGAIITTLAVACAIVSANAHVHGSNRPAISQYRR